MTQNKKRILLVDRNPAGTQEIERILKADGGNFIVYTAKSPLHAIDTIYSEPPDLVVIDHSVGADEGGDLCRRIKSDTVFGHLPIILLLDTTSHSTDIKWENTPADDYHFFSICTSHEGGRCQSAYSPSRESFDHEGDTGEN